MLCLTSMSASKKTNFSRPYLYNYNLKTRGFVHVSSNRDVISLVGVFPGGGVSELMEKWQALVRSHSSLRVVIIDDGKLFVRIINGYFELYF